MQNFNHIEYRYKAFYQCTPVCIHGDPKYEWNRIWLFSIPILSSILIPILFIPIFSIPNPIFFQNQIQYFFFLYQISYTEFKTFYSNFFDTQSETFLKPNPKPSNKSKSLEIETESQLQTKSFVKFDLGFFSVLLMLLQYFKVFTCTMINKYIDWC